MKLYFYTILALSILGVFIYSLTEANAKKRSISIVNKSFYDLTIQSLDGAQSIKMSDFKGKYVLCVNVASECGYTPQYQGLEELYNKYKDKLVVIGFPCNQFMGQEPGTPEQIMNFCKKNYGVTFLLTQKINVKGDDVHPVYQWLLNKQLNNVSDATIKWNFNKILISPDGVWLKHFGSGVEPMSAEITQMLN